MPADLLVHLITPGDWRAALSAGAVRPPSLVTEGFVHLSAPGQVHLPAARLFPGRRDVVLLVVDPRRLTAPVRWEPGDPGDPGSMRFPHLYGELPTSAVVAVVPWRAGVPLELPDPGDADARARALMVSLPVRRAPQVQDLPGGFAVADPAFPHSRDDNRVLLTALADAGAVEAVTSDVAARAGWPAAAATLLHPGSAPVAAELEQRGWEVSPTVVMARWAPFPEGPPPRVEAVPQEAVHGLWDAQWRRELTELGAELDEVVAQLVGREHRTDRVVAVTDLAVQEGGRVVATAQLRIDGATAWIESVVTDPAARRQGHGDALVAAALGRAAAAGCDLVLLEAAVLDWPREWYARRGFSVVAQTWEAVSLR
ncbi:GNAT family N-acetyltransferase [Modestobacter marinus]|uniref:GNAT family N-acetyltransferase n=1 Tax=Modestobacter marinus TaxID=477641 RepID=UPI001C9774B8|nr:GNAT family N-acetyltransferase [Modestobacter marinus]